MREAKDRTDLIMPMQNFLEPSLAVAMNELRQLRRSRARLMLSLVVIPLFFTSALGGASGGEGTRFSVTASIPMAFVDDDLSVASGRLYQALVRSGDFNRLIQGYRVENAVTALGTGRVFAAIIVPKGFQKELDNNQVSRIVLCIDDGEPFLGDTIQANLQSALRDFDARLEIYSPKENASSNILVVQKGRAFSGFAVGMTIVLAVVQIFATFYEIAGGISRDREEGTYARLLLSPAGVGSIVLGKTLYDLVLNIIRTLTVLGISTTLYGAQLNTDLGSVLAISLLIALVTMGFGFAVSSLKVGVRAVVILEFFLVLFLFSFSGIIIDRELFRGYSAIVSSLLPWSYGFEALRSMNLAGRSLLDLTYHLQVIVASIIVFYVASYVLLNLSRERLVT